MFRAPPLFETKIGAARRLLKADLYPAKHCLMSGALSIARAS